MDSISAQRKALIIGCNGFVGRYLYAELESNGYDVWGADLKSTDNRILALNLLNPDDVRNALLQVQPDRIFHLAGQADVKKSWEQPQSTFEINVIGTLNLLEAVRKVGLAARILLVGSSDQYGTLGALGNDITESVPCHPRTPYAVSKMTQEAIGVLYAKAYQMHICMTRSFNHAGAGQKEGFMIPDFATGIVKVERSEANCVKVGNLDAKRDFTHVKDVVRAYRLISEMGGLGEIYNVGSGRTYSAREILERLCTMTQCQIRIEQDPKKMRPSDTPVICCDYRKLTKDTGWKPEIGIDEILEEVMNEKRMLLKNN